MTRLQSEFQRLYTPEFAGDRHPLIDPAGRVRAMVMELGRPASWDAVARAWQGIQADLQLPAPAIAVNGQQAYQLWFSLEQAVPCQEARAVMTHWRDRYWADIDLARTRLLPHPEVGAEQTIPPEPAHAQAVPALQADGVRWSAFLAPDLASMFAEDPWLDFPPSEDGQADLLCRLTSIRTEDWRRLLAGLYPVTPSTSAATPPEPLAAGSREAVGQGPREFLRRVMNDTATPLTARIDAAKALLPYTQD